MRIHGTSTRTKLLRCFLALAGATALGVAASHVAAYTETEIVVHDPDRHIGEVKVGTKTEVSFLVENPTDNDAMITGLFGACGLRGCISFPVSAPLLIPRRSMYELKCIVDARLPGEIQIQAALWVFDHEYREVILVVRGQGV